MDWGSALQGLLGGVLIGASASWLMAALGRVAGISGIVSGLLFDRPTGDTAWRLTFLLGLVSGPVLLLLLGEGGNVAGQPDAVVGPPVGGAGLMLAAGALVGFGTGIGSGCTSGHGVCGLSRLSVRSLMATVTFLVAGMVTVYVSRHLMGVGA
ncbi:hypothetical protein C8D92_106115 [Tamilnaduibacter salinus]|uniref:YeeE/YedE family protein n=1 Tax=Tamilnaduibacter salinus TaxID=1484056 RepID=A0A2A2I3K2_9GAMM|nr:hypothetical protein [Tamilnaduibacter salinus]PAV26601.1 hypothetical protein CF392_05180 [Tamilnaduibacter salinus]PVY75855.1 hypothetical protein C8D92_106115 [Tamilnaduibacter salinus]